MVIPCVRHECVNIDTGPGHTKGDGKAKRKKCAYCGSRIHEMSGYYIVCEWRRDAMYELDQARSTHRSRKAAEIAAGDDLVVRWIPA